jgi:hypothetical protein
VVAWLLILIKTTRGAANDDSPIIIKAGSFSVALFDDLRNVSIKEDASDRQKYEIHSDSFGTAWTVALSKLEAGFPVETSEHANPDQVVLYLVDDNDAAIDTVTVEFTGQYVTLRTDRDRNFGHDALGNYMNFKKGAKKHSKRVIHKNIHGQQELNITKVVVTGGDNPGTLTAGEIVVAISC